MGAGGLCTIWLAQCSKGQRYQCIAEISMYITLPPAEQTPEYDVLFTPGVVFFLGGGGVIQFLSGQGTEDVPRKLGGGGGRLNGSECKFQSFASCLLRREQMQKGLECKIQSFVYHHFFLKAELGQNQLSMVE